MMRRRLLFLCALAGAGLLTPATLQSQAGPLPRPQDQLWDAAISGDTLALKEALQRGAAIDSIDTRTNVNGRRALNWAAWYDRVDALRILLAHGARIDAGNHTWNTPLHHAAEAGALGTLRALLQAGADVEAVNLNGERPLEVARRRGHEQAAALLEQAMRERRPVSP